MSKEIATQNNSLMGNQESAYNIGGVEGLDVSQDIKLPYVYIVQDNSKHAVDEKGNKAPAGKLFNSTRKVSYDSLRDAIIVYARGADEYNEERGQEERVFRALVVTRDAPYAPFWMKFRGMTLWYGFQDFLNMMVGKYIYSVVVNIGTKTYTTKGETGKPARTNFVPVFTVAGDTTEEEREFAKSIALKYKNISSEDERDEEELPEIQQVDEMDDVGDLSEGFEEFLNEEEKNK